MFLNQPKSSFMTAEHSQQRLLTQYSVHKVFKLTTLCWCKLWKDLLLSNITLVKTTQLPNSQVRLLTQLRVHKIIILTLGQFWMVSTWKNILTLVNYNALSKDYWLIYKVVKLVQLFYQESWNERTKRKMERRCKLRDRSSFSSLWELFRHSFAGSKVALKFITRMQLWEWVWHFSQKPLHKRKKIKQQ